MEMLSSETAMFNYSRPQISSYYLIRHILICQEIEYVK